MIAVRALRARVVLAARGFTSHDEFRSRSFTWDQVAGFSDRGTPIRNKVAVDLVSGGWVGIQHHPYAADLVRRLQVEEARLRASGPAPHPGSPSP